MTTVRTLIGLGRHSVFQTMWKLPLIVSTTNSKIHTTCCQKGRRDPGQYKNILEFVKMGEDAWSNDLGTWSDNNKMVYAPLSDKIRPAELYYGRSTVRHSPKKLWYMTKVILHKNIDEAIGMLGSIREYKGAEIVADILKDAKEEAVNHNVEFPSNMHIASATVLPAGSRKFIRWRARSKADTNRSYFANFYILLCEGSDPNPYKYATTIGETALDFLNNYRYRNIRDGL